MCGIDPVDDGLVINSKQATDAAEAVAFEVQLKCYLFGISIIAKRQRFRCIGAAAYLTLVTLVSGAVEAGLNLSFGILAIRASHHANAYNIVRFDLDSP